MRLGHTGWSGVEELDTLLPAGQEEERTEEEAARGCHTLLPACWHWMPLQSCWRYPKQLECASEALQVRASNKGHRASSKGQESQIGKDNHCKQGRQEEKRRKRRKQRRQQRRKRSQAKRQHQRSDNHSLLLTSNSSSDEEPEQKPAARATRGRKGKGRKLEQQDDQPNQAMAQQVMHSPLVVWW